MREPVRPCAPLPCPLCLTQSLPAAPSPACDLQVTRHKQCRIRITVSERPGAVPQNGHKVGGWGCESVLACGCDHPWQLACCLLHAPRSGSALFT